MPEHIKYFADPYMYPISYVSKEPNNRWLLMQCMDNTILTYGAKEKIYLNKNEKFKGHKNAGYACQVDTSPDGRYVLSGDGNGRCFFWDWKTARILRNIKAHHGTC